MSTKTTEAEQAQATNDDARLRLYHYASCPFCMLVRRVMDGLGLQLEQRDILSNGAWRRELIEGGGRVTVPCLRIEHADGRVEWMYESSRISRYLIERFAP